MNWPKSSTQFVIDVWGRASWEIEPALWRLPTRKTIAPLTT